MLLVNIGKKAECPFLRYLEPLVLYSTGVPAEMPSLEAGQAVYCGLNQGFGEDLYLCRSLEEMRECDSAYGKGLALNIHWYQGPAMEEVNGKWGWWGPPTTTLGVRGPQGSEPGAQANQNFLDSHDVRLNLGGVAND